MAIYKILVIIIKYSVMWIYKLMPYCLSVKIYFGNFDID